MLAKKEFTVLTKFFILVTKTKSQGHAPKYIEVSNPGTDDHSRQRQSDEEWARGLGQEIQLTVSTRSWPPFAMRQYSHLIPPRLSFLKSKTTSIVSTLSAC